MNDQQPDPVKDSLLMLIHTDLDPNQCLQGSAVCSGRTRMKTWCPSPARASWEGPRPSRTVSTSDASSYSNQVGILWTLYPFLHVEGVRILPRSISFSTLFSSVGDPDSQDPHIFGSPESGSVSQMFVSGSRSFPFLIMVLSGLK